MSDARNDARRLALLQAALDHIDQGFTAFDANLEMIGWNRRFFELLEFPTSLAKTGTHFSAFMRYNAERGEYGEGDIDDLVQERVERARQFAPHEMERRRPSGEIIAVRGTPLPGGGFVTTYTDITAIRERQAILERAVADRTRALSDSESKLRLITDAIPAHIAYLDERRIYRFANRRYATWFGFTVETILGQPIENVIEKPILDRLDRQIWDALSGISVTYEYRRQGPDGRMADMRSTLIPDQDIGGTVHGCFVLSLDITEQKNQETALRRAQKMEAIGQLTGGIAHDFNNLLTVILGNLQALRERGGEGPATQDSLDPAIHAARRGVELTSRLLTFAREQPLDIRPVDVEKALGQILPLLQRSLPSTIEVRTNIDGFPPPALVNPGQLENALLNLALNARDAIIGPGSITFDLSAVTLTEAEAREREIVPGRYIRMDVSDNGCGIDPETLSRLFDPFFTTKEFGAGSGLGLSMVYGFIRQSSGAIDFTSTPGKGTRVRLLLPVAPTASVADSFETPVESVAFGDALVLLVEDDPQVRAVVRNQLITLGCRVLEAETASDALHLVQTVVEIRYLLSDIVMPGQMDGVALARAAKAAAPDLQVGLITGYAGPVDGAASETSSFPILRKPFTESELAALLARAV